MNKIAEFLEGLFGPSWRTTVWGGITVLSILIAAQPDSVAFLPDQIEGYVKGIAGLIAAATGIKFAHETKSKDVTGGNVPATKEAKDRIENVK